MEPVSVPEIQKDAASSSSTHSPGRSQANPVEPPSNPLLKRRIQIASWLFLALAGLAQAWFERHRIFSDGVSYLEIASYYAKGDWHSALNSYWSPLYSWILAAIMVVFRPNPYWHISLLHLVNYGAYLASLAGFEAVLSDLVYFQRRHIGSNGLSEITIRIVGYSVFLAASLLLIGTGYNSPDMVAMAIMFYLLHVLLQIEAGTARTSTYLLFGAALGLEYLCRAAFAPFIALYIMLAGLLLWNRAASLLRPLGLTMLTTVLVAVPFIVALSTSKGRFTLGDAGKLNYGWEVDGAARSTNWQGEPYDIGKPLHPTRKVLDHPATYTFVAPVAGSYPPWYEPSYFYEGIKPKFKFRSQMKVFLISAVGVVYLLLRSPVTIPVLVLVFFMGWRRWFSNRGIMAYWFLLLPTVAYVLAFTLVYLDPRYIAGSLVVIWMCLLASVSMPTAVLRARANRSMQVIGVLFALVFGVFRLAAPARAAASDLVHLRESEWNLNWLLADRMMKMGLQPNDRVAWIGQAIDAEWARLVGVKIVAEVPVSWERDNTLFRRAYGDRKQVKAFWWSTPEEKAKVFQAFRDAGATVVVLENMPNGVDQTGWQRVLPKGTPHLTKGVGQYDFYQKLYFKRLAPPGTPAQ